MATPEGVSLDVTLAGFGSRFGAYSIDFVIQLSVFLVLYLLPLSLIFSPTNETNQLLFTGLLFVGFVMIFLGYFVICEMLWSGRSIGKRAVGLRVVMRDGSSERFWSSLLRNVARIIDFLPFWYIVGSIAILASTHNQRLGDMMGGTLVIRERHGVDRYRQSAFDGLGSQWGRSMSNGAPTIVTETTLPDELVRWDVSAVTDEEIQLIRQFLGRRYEYSPAARDRLARSLAERIRPRVMTDSPVDSPETFLALVSRVKSARR